MVWAQAATNNTSISALIGSVDGSSETVDAYLEQNHPGNVIASASFTVGAFASAADFTLASIFSGLNLSSDFYRLTLFNADTTGDVNVRWSVGSTTTNTDAGAFFGSQYSDAPDSDVSLPYLSKFNGSNAPLGFNVSGDISTPEPATIFSAMGAVVAFVAVRMRRRGA